MVKISQNRVDLEDGRLEQAIVKDYAETVKTITASAAQTYDLDITQGNIFDIAHSANITLTVSNPSASGVACSITIIRTKDNNTTERTITWPSSFYWPGGTAPTLTSLANAVDIIVAVTRDGGAMWIASPAGYDMK